MPGAAEVKHDREANGGDQHRVLNRGGQIGDQAHERRKQRAADDRHDNQRRADLGVFANILDAEREYRGEHDRHKKAGRPKRDDRGHALDAGGGNTQQNIQNRIERQQPLWRDAPHQRDAREAAYHKRDKTEAQIIGRCFFRRPGQVLGEVNEITPDPHLRADVEELRDHGVAQMPESQNAPVKQPPRLAFKRKPRKRNQEDHQRKDRGDRRQPKIGRLNRPGLCRAIRGQRVRRHPRQFLRRVFYARKDQRPADKWRKEGPQPVKGLREIQTPGRASGVAHHGDIRIGGRFQKGEAGRDHEQRAQEKRETPRLGRREKQQGAQRIQRETGNNAVLESEPAHDHAGRQGQQEIAKIEGGLHQAGLHTAQIKRLLKLLDQDVIKVVRDRPEKKQRGHADKGQRILSVDKGLFVLLRFGAHCYQSSLLEGLRAEAE